MSRFSDYYDRRGAQSEAGPMEAHLEACASCSRYHRVVSEAGQLLRALPRPGVPSDFRPRLQHRIYHVEDEAVLDRSSGSGTTGATAMAMAILLTLAAWTPTMTEGPAEGAPAFQPVAEFGQANEARSATPRFHVQSTSVLRPQPIPTRSLWTQAHSHSLLYEYSLLSTGRTRERAQLRQTGLE